MLSAPLVTELVQSNLIASELATLRAVNRSWGPAGLEDIWLGSAIHRLYCNRGFSDSDAQRSDASAGGRDRKQKRATGNKNAPVETSLTIVNLAPPFYFNGGWHTGRGFEYNTTWLYHNKHELPLIRQHVNETHEPSQPRLQCAGDGGVGEGGGGGAGGGGAAGGARDRKGKGRAKSRRRRRGARRNAAERAAAQRLKYPPPFAYAQMQARSHQRYLREATCANAAEHTWCTLIEPRYLAAPGMRHHSSTARINLQGRELTASEVARVEAHRVEMRAARLAFRDELSAEGMLQGELGRQDLGQYSLDM